MDGSKIEELTFIQCNFEPDMGHNLVNNAVLPSDLKLSLEHLRIDDLEDE